MSSRLLSRFTILIFVLSFLGFLPGCKDSSRSGEEHSLPKFIQDYSELVKYYDELIEIFPDDLELRIKLAKFYYGFKDYQKVRELLRGSVQIEAKKILAKALVRLKEYDYAIEIFEQLSPLPEDSEYLYLYGEVLEKKNLFPKAVEIYNKVGGEFENLAKEKIKFIRANTESGIPPQILEISKEAESFLEQIEGEAGIVLLVDEEIEITPDNTSVATIRVIKKVLEERGKELAEVEIGYDSTYERVELEFARTITEGGEMVYVGAENIRDVSRYLNFPLYSNSRAFIISMPAVDVGSFIEHKIKVYSSKLVAEDNFGFTYRLRERYPIFKANLRLIIPEKDQINFKFINEKHAEGFNLNPSLIEKDNTKIYTWNFNRIKSIIPEYAMPVNPLINPAVLISSFSSWDEIYKWWHSLWRDKIELTEEIKKFVGDIIKDASGELDKAKKIYEYVTKNIRYVAIEYGESGHEPHYANDVFNNRYGDCKDQAVLLTAMLREAGLEAYPVLIPTRSTYPISEDFPSLNFNHAICALRTGEDLIFMDPTAETTPFSKLPLTDQDRLAMVFFDDGWLIVNSPQLKENGVDYEMDISINDKENAVITRKVVTRGSLASTYRWYLKYSHPAVIEEDIRKKMTEISSLSKLLNYEIKNVNNFDASPVLTYKFTADKILNPAGNLRIIPLLDQVHLDHNLIGKRERNYPIDFGGFFSKTGKIKISLPENLKVKYLPTSRTLKNRWFELNVVYQENAGCIDFYQKLNIRERFVEKEEYQEFKKQLIEAIYLLKEEIILDSSSP